MKQTGIFWHYILQLAVALFTSNTSVFELINTLLPSFAGSLFWYTCFHWHVLFSKLIFLYTLLRQIYPTCTLTTLRQFFFIT